MNASKEATQSLWMQQEVAADAPRLAASMQMDASAGTVVIPKEVLRDAA